MMQYPKLVEVKTLANEIVLIEWNPGMDLLASVFSNGTLTCSRLLSLQKVWTKQSVGTIASIAWRPDGRVLAIGAYHEKTKENICSLLDVENGKKVNTITKDKAITSVSWYQFVPNSGKGDDEVDNEDGSIFKVKKSATPLSETNDEFSHQLAHEQSQLNILVIATDDGRISLYALGLFYLGELSIHDEPNSLIFKTNMSNCLQYLSATISIKHKSSQFTSLKVMNLDTFQRRSNEILKVAKMYAKITDELEYLDDAINAITTSWTDVLAGLDSKLSSYRTTKKAPKENRHAYTFLSANELLHLLVIGFPSDNLEKFLSDMSDKGLKKLNSAIEQTCLRVQNIIVKNAQKCCYHLHKDLNLLRGMSLWHERFQEVGLNDKCILESIQSVGSLVLKLTELQQVIDHSLKSTRSFFRWLISIACRISGEQNNSSVPNDLNKTTQQDIQLITDFVLENFDYDYDMDDVPSVMQSKDFDDTKREKYSRPTCSNFTLEQVGQYLKNEPLTRQKYSFTKPGSNLWIEFCKSKPELTEIHTLNEDGSSTLLFYPHNPDTSLIQEHKKACRSIETAFNSVATNLKLTLTNGDEFITLEHFLKDAPINRIRMETDVQALRHNTLFQTKKGPVARQYLVSHSLQDRTFKLISFEFKTHLRSPTAPSLLIADSSFYENKDTRKLLLTFLLLDRASGSTLIAQMELYKLFDGREVAVKTLRDVSKVFRNSDSIDKHSCHVVLKLDITTEPANLRKNDLDIVVKKIKETTGKSMFTSSGRGVIAFTSGDNKRIHLYELEELASAEIMDDEVEEDERIDESLMDTELAA